jgi:(p)ppGpp synthase/HD superfamily hydrolase
MPRPALPLLHKAVRFAVKAHKKQDREGEMPLPYATHPIDVLNIVRFDADVRDESILCAAALHDVVEEAQVPLKDIADKFGPEVAELVQQLTREEPDEETQKLPEDELYKIRSAMLMAEIDRMSDSAKIVKLADRCSNLRTAPFTKPADKLTRYVDQSRELLKHIDRSVCPVLWDRINQMVEQQEPLKPRSKASRVRTV